MTPVQAERETRTEASGSLLDALATAVRADGRRINPFLTVRRHSSGCFRVIAPRPGRSLCDTEVSQSSHPELVRWLESALTTEPMEASSSRLLADCDELGIAVAFDRIPVMPRFPRELIGDDLAARIQQATTWTEQIHDVQLRLREVKCAVIRAFLPPDVLLAVRDYYRALIANGFLPFNDGQATRYYCHNEAVARRLHLCSAPAICAVMPEPCKPSYCFFGGYVGGAVLDKHTDREQCEYTLSLTIDATGSDGPNDPWPLFADLADGTTTTALLEPGDGLLFKGRELPHYRNELAENRSSTSIFFHYVSTSFTAPLD